MIFSNRYAIQTLDDSDILGIEELVCRGVREPSIFVQISSQPLPPVLAIRTSWLNLILKTAITIAKMPL